MEILLQLHRHGMQVALHTSTAISTPGRANSNPEFESFTRSFQLLLSPFLACFTLMIK